MVTAGASGAVVVISQVTLRQLMIGNQAESRRLVEIRLTAEK